MSTQRRPAAAKTPRSGRTIILVTIAVIVLIGALLVLQETTRSEPGFALADQGNLHLAELNDPHTPYNSTPPTSGPHMPFLTQPGIYDEQVPDVVQVHNLEDGFVNVQYDCPSGCDELAAQLEDIVTSYVTSYLARGSEGRVLMGPYSGITDPETGQRRRIALTAWTRLETFDDLDADRITAFIDAYIGIDHHVLQ